METNGDRSLKADDRSRKDRQADMDRRWKKYWSVTQVKTIEDRRGV